MMKRLIVLTVLAAVLTLGVFWMLTIPATVPASALGPHTPDLANGKEMFYAGGCASCHAVPKQPDMTQLGGGLALNSPFGTFYVPNISSDPKDGIGAWSEAQFVTAMTKGTSPAGEHLYPAFPYTSYQHMRFDDLRDLFAFLKTLPPVAGRVRDHDLPFPFNIRRTLGRLEIAVSRRRAVHARSVAVGAMESRRLSGERARPLRRMPFAAQFSRRHHPEPAIHRRSFARRAGRRSQYHPVQAQGLDGRATSRNPRNRHDAGRRSRRRQHGRGGAQYLAADASRPRRRWRPTSSRCRRSKGEAPKKRIADRDPGIA